MAQEVVKALMLEIDGNLEKLRRELRKGEGDLTGFATKAKATGKDVGAGADAMTNKFGAAARAGASAMETIARTGKASGEAMKQLVAQGSQAALFFGPQGAFIGAIGISTLAIVGMFSRTREEMAALEKQTTDALNRFAELDSKGMQSQLRRSLVGDPFRQSLDNIFAQSDDAARREGLRGRGSLTLGEDAVALRARLAGIGRVQRTTNQGGTFLESADPALEARLKDELKEVLAVREALRAEQERMVPLAQAAAQQEGALEVITKASKKATKDATDAEKERATGLRELASESERLAERVGKLVNETLGGSAERVGARFEEEISRAMQLATDGVDVAGNFVLVDQLAAARDEAVLAAEQMERFAQTFATLERASAEGLAPTISDFWMIDVVIAGAEERLNDLTEGSKSYRDLQAEITKLLQKRKNLLEGVADANVGGAPSSAKDRLRDMVEFAREVQQAADGALQLAQNLGGASESLIGMMRSIVQIAGNLPALAKAIDAGGAMGIVSAGLPILGALSSMFGKSPEERQRAQELRENTQAIREWTAKVGALGGIDVSGSDATGAAGGLRPFLRRFAGNGLLPARSAAQAAGLDLAALDRIAASLGITLNDNIQSFEQLAKQLNATTDKLGEFGDDLDSQRRQAEAEIALFGVTDPLERLRIRQRATGGRSSALDGVTAGLDLSTAEGREQARRNAQALFDVMRAGGGTLGAGELGGLTGDELLQALLDLIDGLRDVEGAVSTAAGGSVVGGVSGYSGLTAAAGAHLEDYNRALVTYARDAQVTRLDMLARLDQLAQHLLGPIPLPPLSALGGGRSGGAVQVTIGSIVIHVQAQGGARDDVLSAIGDGIERVTTDALYRGILQARIVAGDLRVAN